MGNHDLSTVTKGNVQPLHVQLQICGAPVLIISPILAGAATKSSDALYSPVRAEKDPSIDEDQT